MCRVACFCSPTCSSKGLALLTSQQPHTTKLMRYNGFHTGTAVQHAYALGSAPSFLSASGTLEAGYKLSAATRDGRLHALRGGEAPGAAVQLEAQPVGLVRRGSGRAQAAIPRAFPHPAECVACKQATLTYMFV